MVLRQTVPLVDGDVVVKEKVFHINNGKFVQGRENDKYGWLKWARLATRVLNAHQITIA